MQPSCKTRLTPNTPFTAEIEVREYAVLNINLPMLDPYITGFDFKIVFPGMVIRL